nr:hypothetical protein [Bacillota bacterium]
MLGQHLRPRVWRGGRAHGAAHDRCRRAVPGGPGGQQCPGWLPAGVLAAALQRDGPSAAAGGEPEPVTPLSREGDRLAPEETRKIREALRQLQHEVASELTVQVQDEPIRSTPARLAGSLGGPAVRRLLAQREEALRESALRWVSEPQPEEPPI